MRIFDRPTQLKVVFPLDYNYLLGKGGYVFGGVDLSVFVCLSVCGHYSKSYKLIEMKF